MSKLYRQLRFDEREIIFNMKDARMPISRISARLGKHPSNTYQEIKRNFLFNENSYFLSYFAGVVHDLQRGRPLHGGNLPR